MGNRPLCDLDPAEQMPTLDLNRIIQTVLLGQGARILWFILHEPEILC